MGMVRLVAATLVASAALACGATAAASGSSGGGRSPTAGYVVKLSDGGAVGSARTEALERSLGFAASLRYENALQGFAAKLSPMQVAGLRRSPHVAHVVPDAEITATAKKPSAPRVPQDEVTPVGITRIGAAGDGFSAGPAGSAVAVLDTGLDLDHPDLDAAHGVNCIKPGRSSQDDDGHGTHVGGTIAARQGNGGAVGGAPGTRLYAVKVLDSSSKGRLSGLLCGIEWVKTNAERLGIAVANASLTAAGADDGACGAVSGDPLHAAICSSVDAGILYVAAAGNSGADFARTIPAAYSETLAVTAATDTDGAAGGLGGVPCVAEERDDSFATYSNFATTAAAAFHALAGPGTCVVSSALGGGVATMLGTSMAAPHVTAAAALCLGRPSAPGPCASSDPSHRVALAIERLRSDAAAAASAGLGYEGDPLRPLDGHRFGYLVSARGY